MQQANEVILSNLDSKEPERIKVGIKSLKKKMNNVDEFDLPPLGIDIFEPFGDIVPEDIQLDFIDIVRRYHSFTPELTAEEKLKAMIEMVLRYGNRYVAFDVALKLKIAANPVQAIKMAMEEMVSHDLKTSTNIKGASYFVSRLLDGKEEIRMTTLKSLREWPKGKLYMAVTEYINPQLEPEEKI